MMTEAMTDVMTEDRIFEVVKRHLLTIMPDLDPQVVSIDNALADFGCNSIDRVDIVTMTMEELGITVPVMEFQEVHNIRTLVDLLRKYTS